MIEEIQDKFCYPVLFQKSILSYLFSDNVLFRKFSTHISPYYFTEYQLQDIAKVSLNFFNKYEEVPDESSLINELNDICLSNEYIYCKHIYICD